MWGRASSSLLLLALMTGLAHAQSRAVLGPLVVATSAPVWVDAKVLIQVQQSQAVLDAPAVVLPVRSSTFSRNWVDAEVLFWWMKSANLPPLVTASPPGTAAANVGVLGVPGTVVLFGGSSVNGDLSVGGRVKAGRWLGDEQL